MTSTLIDLIQAGPSVAAAFMASLVEFVEALTIVLAVGAVRGWPGALAGSGAAALVLIGVVAVAGPALGTVPIHAVQIVVGTLALLFGMRWLRKAILRAAGLMAPHDETKAYSRQTELLQRLQPASRTNIDRIAFATAFQITMLEGIEVVFIVIAVGTAKAGLLLPAATGAIAALLLVILLGITMHRPLSRVPENTLKFIVGVLLSAFGTFWVGEGIGLQWPGGDWSVVGLVAAFLALAMPSVPLVRTASGRVAQRKLP